MFVESILTKLGLYLTADHFTQHDSVLSKDTSGYCLSEGRIQAQWALRAALVGAQLA